MTKVQLLDRITMTLGGRVAEEMIYGSEAITTGASNDLEKVTALARKWSQAYGYERKNGQYGLLKERRTRVYGA